MHKKCPKCDTEYPLTEEFFNKNKSKKDGFQSSCIKCQKAYNAGHYRKNEDVYKKRGKQSKSILEERFREIKSGYSCVKCGESESCCIDFHHVDPSTKESGVAKLRYSSLEILMKEIDKCVPICANCHRKFHAGLIEI